VTTHLTGTQRLVQAPRRAPYGRALDPATNILDANADTHARLGPTCEFIPIIATTGIVEFN
jgi:hypothetical protein